MKYYYLEGNLNDGIPTDAAFHQVLNEHHAYLKRFFDEGKILASGPKILSQRRTFRATGSCSLICSRSRSTLKNGKGYD